jgi:ATP-dependent RNA helicase DeaD
LLPLICRYGHVGRNDIGAIRLAANESYFEVTQRATPSFIKALRRATIAPEDAGLVIEQAEPRGSMPAPHAKRQAEIRPREKPKHYRKKAGGR